jgi:OOP family OmpA-OmpF porin
MANSGPDRPAATNPGADTPRNGDLDELRELLLGPERAGLVELREHIQNRSQRTIDLSEVLPDAIILRASRDPRLRQALEPIIEKALADSVRRDPRILAEALFPVIAGAVRRAVASALQSMMESLNQIVETSVSLRSVGWRIEAVRTGKSYAEVALLRSLLYRVEQVFLIQNETGLLLQHVMAGSVVARDADMISGMLTAIQNFVQDSFGAPDNTLETVRVGEFSVWIRHGPQALLAAVIHGTPPLKLREAFDSALDSIHRDYGTQLAEFQGDAAILDGARPALERCLLGQSPPGQRSSRMAIYVIGLLLIALLATWAGFSLRDNRRWRDYVATLRKEEGIVITHEARDGSKYAIWGLRDPLSTDPAQLLGAANIPAARVSFNWEPYQSLSPRFARLRAFTDSKNRLEKQVIHFDTGKSELAAGDSLRTIADLVSNLLKAGESVGEHANIEIVGHTDDHGSAESNDQLGLDRATAVRSALVRLGVDGRRLDVATVGSRQPLEVAGIGSTQAENRSVSFHVHAGSGR